MKYTQFITVHILLVLDKAYGIINCSYLEKTSLKRRKYNVMEKSSLTRNSGKRMGTLVIIYDHNLLACNCIVDSLYKLLIQVTETIVNLMHLSTLRGGLTGLDEIAKDQTLAVGASTLRFITFFVTKVSRFYPMLSCRSGSTDSQ